MLQLLVFLIFIVSVAMAAGGIILTSKLRRKHQNEVFPVLLYYEVFIYAFGFYGIWGQVVIKAFLSQYLSEDLITRTTDIAVLLGLPFLVFGWLMLIRLACLISGRICKGWFIWVFLVLNFGALVVTGWLISGNETFRPTAVLKAYFVFMNTLYALISFCLILYRGKGETYVHQYDRRIIAAALLTLMLMQCAPLITYNGQSALGILFILIFFTGNSFLPMYFSYGMEVSTKAEKVPVQTSASFEEFCRKYEVSPRESEIIREICNGLSNKEIADKLFITLQTVKDHTHRIYIKTNVKSRVQLMNLVKMEW